MISSLSSGLFPACLKDAQIYLLFETASESSFGNNRVISILPTLSKTIERFMYEHIDNFKEKNYSAVNNLGVGKKM